MGQAYELGLLVRPLHGRAQGADQDRCGPRGDQEHQRRVRGAALERPGVDRGDEPVVAAGGADQGGQQAGPAAAQERRGRHPEEEEHERREARLGQERALHEEDRRHHRRRTRQAGPGALRKAAQPRSQVVEWRQGWFSSSSTRSSRLGRPGNSYRGRAGCQVRNRGPPLPGPRRESPLASEVPRAARFPAALDSAAGASRCRGAEA